MKRYFYSLVCLIVLTGFFAPGTWGQAKLPKVKVGMTPITDYLQLFAAVEKGFFRQQGLDVETVGIWRIGQKLEALAGGSIQITGVSPPSFLMSKDKGFDFIAVAAGAMEPNKPPFTSAIMVKKDAGINRWRDLAGKKVGLASLRSLIDLYIVEAVKKDGGDPSGIEWVRIRFSAMGPAVLTGKINAGLLVEPFLTDLKARPGVKSIGSQFHYVRPGALINLYVTLEKWLKNHPDTGKSFVQGMRKGIDWVAANPQAARKLLLKYTRLKPNVITEIAIKDFQKKVDMEELQWTSDLLLKRGWINKKQDVSKFVSPAAR